MTTTPQPDESVADLIARGKVLLAQKEFAQAIPLFERATQREPGNFSAWSSLGYAHNESEQWQQGLAAIEHALVIRPDDAAIWNNKGNALDGLDRYEEAVAAFDRALALDPNLAYTWVNKGVALARLGRYEEALAAFDRALALDPTSAKPGLARAPRWPTWGGVRRRWPPYPARRPSAAKPKHRTPNAAPRSWAGGTV